MNKKCGIARDLMPLVIDNAASEESGEYVFRHIQGCAECKTQFEEMKKEIGSPVASENDAAFAHSVWQLKHKQKKKKALLSLLCLFLALCLAFAGIEIYNGLLIYNSVVKPYDDLEIGLFTLPSGEMQIWAKSKDETDVFYHLRTTRMYGQDGKVTLYIWAIEPRYDFLDSYQSKNTSSLYGYKTGSGFYMIDGKLYSVDLDYSVKTLTSRKENRGLEYNVQWYAPVAIDEIRYGDPSEQTDGPVLYRTGDKIDEISADDYIARLEETFGGEQDLPHNFYGNNTYVFALAKAWIRGEELPEIPREYLPSIMDFPDMEGGTEKATLYVYTTIPQYSTQSEPLVIGQHSYRYTYPIDPPTADEAEVMDSSEPTPLPTATKKPE